MTGVEAGGVPPGTRLNEMYEIVRRIGVGGMGEVYAAREIHSGHQVAIKMVLPEFSGDQAVIDLFRREASHLSGLRHDAIVRYSAFSVDPHLRRPYMAMEFALGPSLRERLRRGRPLTEEEFEHLRARIAGGLATAHTAGIFHRDISPDNIILVDDNVARAMIIDFGIAKSANEEKTLIGDSLAGKLGYASPEQMGLSGGQVTAKADVYSLGIIFAEAATAQPMNMGGTQANAVETRKTVPPLDHVPDDYRPLITAMLHPDPLKRPDMVEVTQWEFGAKPTGGGALRTMMMGLLGVAATAALLAGLWFFLMTGAKLTPPSDTMITASQGSVGEAYHWQVPTFNYSGEPGTLRLATKDALPPGLSFTANKGGTAVISGTPASPADVEILITANGQDGTEADQKISIKIKPAPNLPPKVVERVDEAIQLTVGTTVDLKLGAFSDDKGSGALNVRVVGQLPRGLTVRLPEPGQARLTGTPREAGVFSIELVATDASNESASFTITMSVENPAPPVNAALRRLLTATNSVSCTFVHATSVQGNQVAIAGYIRSLGPLNKLDQDMKREIGRAPEITAWLVTRQQCRFIDSLGAVDAAMVEHDASIDLGKPVRATGSLIKGTVVNGPDALLYIVDHNGRTYELQANTRVVGRDLEFQTRLIGLDAQLIVAAIPTAPGALAGARTLADIVRPSMRGRVKLAIGYVKLKAN